jgi:integrase
MYNVKGADGRWRTRVKKLAPFCDDYRTMASVQSIAQEILGPHNTRQARPEPTASVAGFISNTYLPYCKANLRPSTYFGYCHLYKKLIETPLGTTRLRDFGPVEGDKLLADIASEKQRARTVLNNVKSFLSGAFRYAVRTGLIRFNPMRETVVPRTGKPMVNMHAYTLEEIEAMLKVLPEPSRTAVLVAALTGLRHSEIRGLRWEDFTGDELRVQRSVWASHVTETKTKASTASVPVIPMLRKALAAHRKQSTGEFIFSGGTGRPLVLANHVKRFIVPKLEAAKVEWQGWHPFRRGLATNLYALGVNDKTIQTILRHANVSTTMAHYVKSTSADSRAAMKKLDKAVSKLVGKTRPR